MAKKKKWWSGGALSPAVKIAARSFAPHSFETKVRFLGGLPRILITKEALDRMYHYVDIADKEVGWLGTCHQEGNDVIVDRVFLFEQQVSHTSTEITVDGLAKFSEDILITHPKSGLEILNNLRFWGHSHVNMGTSPSHTDEDQMKVFTESGHDFFLRAILNKSGRMEFTLFLNAAGITLTDVEWGVITQVDDKLRAEIEAEMQQKVKTHWTTIVSPHSPGSWQGGNTTPAPDPISKSPYNYEYEGGDQ